MRCLIPHLQCTVKSTPLKLFIFLYFKISHTANATNPSNIQSLFSNFDKPRVVGTSSLNVESSPETHPSAGNDPERAWLSPQPLPLPLPFSWAISRRGFEVDCQISVVLERIVLKYKSVVEWLWYLLQSTANSRMFQDYVQYDVTAALCWTFFCFVHLIQNKILKTAGFNFKNLNMKLKNIVLTSFVVYGLFDFKE